MIDKTLKRIEEDAEKYAANHSSAPDKETPDWIKMDFIAGAKSERNKAIDDCRIAITNLQGGINHTLLEKLESLKL